MQAEAANQPWMQRLSHKSRKINREAWPKRKWETNSQPAYVVITCQISLLLKSPFVTVSHAHSTHEWIAIIHPKINSQSYKNKCEWNALDFLFYLLIHRPIGCSMLAFGVFLSLGTWVELTARLLNRFNGYYLFNPDNHMAPEFSNFAFF